MISLLAGKPNADTYPITSLQFTLRDPVSNEEVPVSLTEAELARSLQYSGSKGIPDFLEWLVGLQEYSHGRGRGEGRGRGRGEGRGGRGRGEGRGRGSAPRQAAATFNVDDESAFPSLS